MGVIAANAPHSATPKTIHPGTRVRYIVDGEWSGEEGTYMGVEGLHHLIKWDDSPNGWIDWHMDEAFEVI